MDEDDALQQLREMAEVEKAPSGVGSWRSADFQLQKHRGSWLPSRLQRPVGAGGLALAGIAVLAVGLVSHWGIPNAHTPIPGSHAIASLPPGATVSPGATSSLNQTSGLATPSGGATHSQAPIAGPTPASSGPATRISTWGYRTNGDAGDGTPQNGPSTSIPAQLAGFTAITTAGGRGDNGFAVKADGTVVGWGPGWAGQLGDGSWSTVYTPVQVVGSGGVGYLSGVVQIAVGSDHVVVLRSDGSVWSWGRNDYGQLGDATAISRNIPEPVCAPGQPFSNPVPTANLGVTTPASPCTSFLTGVVQIAVGGAANFALKADGSVYAWGPSWGNLLGNGASGASPCPVKPWGPGGPYQCEPVPVPVCGGVDGNMAAPCGSHLTGVRQIAATGADAFALMQDGTVRAWGDDSGGEIGNGSSCAGVGCSPYKSPVAVPALTGVTQIAGGSEHALALKSDGTVLAWGDNGSGQLGINTACNGGVEPCIGSTTPVAVNVLKNVTQIAAGDNFSAAIESNGTLWTWGDNGSGQLGKPPCGTDPCYAAGNGQPAQVGGLSGVAAVYLEAKTVILLSR